MKFMLFVLPTVPAPSRSASGCGRSAATTSATSRCSTSCASSRVFADDAGFDVFATTEHHFHSEGYETSVAPLLLYADLAARTKRIKFSPLGLVLPAWDPIRAAEELAVLDHLTKGRIYAGFARGYQERWVNVLGQQYHVTGAPMDGSAIDNHNRKRLRGDAQGHQEGLDRGSLGVQRRVLQGALPLRGGHPALAGRRLDPRHTARRARSTRRASSAGSASSRSPTSSRTRRCSSRSR